MALFPPIETKSAAAAERTDTDREDGLRQFTENVELEPWLKGGRGNDSNNWGPRVGAAFTLTENTVLRGGAGRDRSMSAEDGSGQLL